MLRKISILILFGLLFQTVNAQNEFITLWKPNHLSNTITVDAPTQAGLNQIWFPGIGENYTINWEEVNYPQHYGTMINVTSSKQVLINFGNALNPNPTDATYIVKVSNGNGIFKQIRFAKGESNPPGGSTFTTWKYNGSVDKIGEIQQWGNIKWNSMHAAFANCPMMKLTAADVPNLSQTEDASYMFYNDYQFFVNPSLALWDTSSIKNFKYMFAQLIISPVQDLFNPPIGNWDTSAAEDFSYMFYNRPHFNENLNKWDTSKVTNMSYMFASTTDYNQPMDDWDTSKVTDMSYMFHVNPNFNQPLNHWNISNVTDLSHMFHNCKAFNQPLSSWDTSKVTNISIMFTAAEMFDQNLGSWNLPMLTNALGSLTGSGLSCKNYSKTILGWAQNPNTAWNINLGSLLSFHYSSDVSDKRNILINKGWTFLFDTIGECQILSVAENSLKNTASIYPNPSHDIIYLKNISNMTGYIILDASGRMVTKDRLTKDTISVESLAPGNYILQIISKEKIQSFKFIKK